MCGVGRPVVAQFCRDVSAVHAHAEAAGVVATAHGFLRTLTPGTWGKMRAAGVVATMQGFPLWAAMGRILHGWALAMQGQGAEGMAQVCQGIATMQATGAALFVPYMCTLLADVAAHLGHPADGLQALTEAHTLVEHHEERWWEAEVARLRGVLLLRQPETAQAEAEAWLQRALDVARRQEAKVAGAAGRHEPQPPLAAAGQASRSPRPTGPNLRLVHRGL